MGNRSDSKVESLVLGFILILLGSLFLLHNVTPINVFPHIWKLWPLVLIILGGSHLARWLSRTGRLGFTSQKAAAAGARPRKHRGKELVLVAVVILVGLVISSFGTRGDRSFAVFSGSRSGHSSEKILEQPLELGRNGLLRLTNEFGPVTVTADDGDEPRLECRLTLIADSLDEAETRLEEISLTITGDGETLDISCRLPDAAEGGVQLEAAMELRVPSGTSLVLDSRNGPVTVTGLRGEVRIQAANERVTVRESGGPVSVTTGRGNIRLEQIAGPVDAASRGGTIEVTECGSDLAVKNSGGTVVCTTVLGRTSIELQEGKLVLDGARGPVLLEITEAKARIEEIGGPLSLKGQDCGLSLTNCYSTVSLEGDLMNVKTMNIRRDLTLRSTHSTIILNNTLGNLEARMEHGSLTCEGKLYRSRIEGSFTPISVSRCEGLLEITSRQGDVALHRLDPGSGNHVSVTTSGGNILLELNPEQCDFNLNMTAVSGMITSFVPGLEITTLEPQGDDGEETILGVARCGSGNQLIELRAEYADIRLEPTH